MLAAIGEFEHYLIVERTQDGLAASRARGRRGGPKFKMTPNRARQDRAMYDAGGHASRRSSTPSASPAPPSTGASGTYLLPRRH